MLKVFATAAATAAILSIGAVAAQADCTSSSAGISKDGSLAPLQQPGATAAGTIPGTATGGQPADGTGGLAKDGSTMPLASEPGGGSDVATSPQDVQRQQDGQPTAAASGGSSGTAPATSC